jgi:hypothetical protein
VIATHYTVLGVRADASSAEIRAAYRERARRMHPDRVGPAVDDHTSMATLNEAYRVLRDPGRRALYDSALRAGAAPLDGSPADVTPADGVTPVDGVAMRDTVLSPSGPARVPWRLMTVVAVVGSSLVLVSSFFDDRPEVEVPDGILRADSCVQFEPNGDVREVACTGLGDVVVELLIPLDATCPAGLTGHRDRLGLGIACIET